MLACRLILNASNGRPVFQYRRPHNNMAINRSLTTVSQLKIRDFSGEAFKGFSPYPTAFPYGYGMVLHFYQQQESSTTKTVHKVINKGLKTYV